MTQKNRVDDLMGVDELGDDSGDAFGPVPGETDEVKPTEAEMDAHEAAKYSGSVKLTLGSPRVDVFRAHGHSVTKSGTSVPNDVADKIVAAALQLGILVNKEGS